MTALAEEIGFSEEELQLMLDKLDSFTQEEQLEILKIAEVLEQRAFAQLCRDDLIEFCKYMQPDYKVGKHHRVLADMLMAIAHGEKDRVCVNMPPRHGKSQLVSIYFPAWFLGKFPNKKVLMVSHTADLAVDFGRKVRNLIATEKYKDIFPGVQLAADSKSAGRWNTSQGGEYYACGVGSALAGRGADLLLVDDPHNEQDILNGNFEVFEKAYEWFAFGARTRLMPGGRVAVVQCMTGDTPVLMADGAHRQLKDIKVGDCVATYDHWVLSKSQVLNHTSNGVDRVFAIKTTCGKIVKANERHPFLIDNDGGPRWVRLKNLKVGDTLVALKGAHAHQKLKQGLVSAARARHRLRTTASTLMRPLEVLGIGGSTKMLLVVRTDATPKLLQGVCALGTTTSIVGKTGQSEETRKPTGKHTLNTGTESHCASTTRCLPSKTGYVPSVNDHLTQKIQGHTGLGSYASIIVTTLKKYVGCCVTTATSLLDTAKQKTYCAVRRTTSDFTRAEIAEVVYVGTEEVFDVQVEKTENFIANGLVSHNTRWHMDDMTGRLTRDMHNNELADQYEVVEFPAILEITDKITGNIVEKPLWPEFFDMPALLRTKASMPVFQWNAQYQQNPTAEEASIVKREWWNIWEKEDPPSCEYVIMTLDTAAETHNRADFTALTTWGVFVNQETNEYGIILLNSIKKRVEFPELKELAHDEWKHWNPDAFIVEKKSSGTALYQELRRMRVPVQEYTPHRGSGDKLARLNSVADIVRSGLCWVPQMRWAEELVEEVAGFPFMSNDDLVDCTTMALMRFRQGGFIRLPTDEKDDPTFFKQKRGGYY